MNAKQIGKWKRVLGTGSGNGQRERDFCHRERVMGLGVLGKWNGQGGMGDWANGRLGKWVSGTGKWVSGTGEWVSGKGKWVSGTGKWKWGKRRVSRN